MDNLDAVFYINLEHRTERKQSIINDLKNWYSRS